MPKGFVECTRCRVWSDIPDKFNERNHFAQCPNCNRAMYLNRVHNPEDLGKTLKNKVKAGLMYQ